jgi:hypothetical protein
LQCPNDTIFADAIVKWDGESDSDFRWDSAHLDCRFSIGIEDTGWHVWIGNNNHSKEDKNYYNVIGGEDIDGNETEFARYFFEAMEWGIKGTGLWEN